MPKASLAIVNAYVVTLNPSMPYARAVAVHGNKIVAVGSNEEIRGFVSRKTMIIDAENGTLVPGLADCHVHMTDFGFLLQSMDLRSIGSIKKMQQKLRQYSNENPGESWIKGGRWDQERFAEKRLPTRWDLDEAIEDRPVLLNRVCGHIAVANSKALQLARITKETVVEGGKVDLDGKTGEPSGVLRENALGIVSRLVPKPGLKQLEEACMLATEKAVEAGLTCVHWMVESAEEIRVLRKLDSEGKLPLRVRLGVSIELLDKLGNSSLLKEAGEGMVEMGFVKILADGSLGAHTAALNEHYSDKHGTRGMLLYSQTTLENLVLKVHKAGFQLAVHAIGDRAIEAVLKAYEKALKAFPRADHRHRIEHSSVLNPSLIKRMKHIGVIASVQPHFVVSDFWVVSRVGKKRARWVYPFKTLLRKRFVVVSGSDCPVENINPLPGIWAATTQNRPKERLTVDEALASYTMNAAYASFDEDKRGSIEAGKLADFTLLSESLHSICSNQIKNVIVKTTIVDGKPVYTKKTLPARASPVNIT
jgi:predicted amidohydrolase YtcJ